VEFTPQQVGIPIAEEFQQMANFMKRFPGRGYHGGLAPTGSRTRARRPYAHSLG
jgi:hypothetical protein